MGNMTNNTSSSSAAGGQLLDTHALSYSVLSAFPSPLFVFSRDGSGKFALRLWSEAASVALASAALEHGVCLHGLFPSDAKVLGDALAIATTKREELRDVQVSLITPDLQGVRRLTVTPVPDSDAAILVLETTHGIHSYSDLLDLYNLAPVAYHSLDALGVFIRANQTELDWLGYPSAELVGVMRFEDLLTPACRELFREQFVRLQASGAIHGFEVELVRADGTVLSAMLSATARYDAEGIFVQSRSVMLDLTERKRSEAAARLALEEAETRAEAHRVELSHAEAAARREAAAHGRTQDTLTQTEKQLVQAQKMEAIGRLAGGVAHDFNNLLTVIMVYTELVVADLPYGDSRRAFLGEVTAAAERAGRLTKQLLSFSRQRAVAPEQVDVNDVVSELECMLSRLVGEDLDFSTSLCAEPAIVHADRGQLEQVLMNLVVNARDAMPCGGELAIEVSLVDLDEGYVQEHYGLEPGCFVLIAVTDTGVGMNSETLNHIFEPFFTTKAPGKGTGLGLSTVYGIVAQASGHLLVDSEVGRGTIFKVFLPKAKVESERRVRHVAAPSHRSAGETVLVVEDEDQVRRAAVQILERNGYRVLDAGSADLALAYVRDDSSIALIISDVVMPGTSGPELVELLRAQRPDVPVLFVSGYTDHTVFHRELDLGEQFLQKPLTPDILLRKVREILSA